MSTRSDYSALKGLIWERFELGAADTGFVSGSILDGVGDRESDLDVYVLTSDEKLNQLRKASALERRLQQQRRNFVMIYVQDADKELDIEFHASSKFSELLEELDRFRPADASCIEEAFDSLGRFERAEAVELLHRFRTGRAFANTDVFDALRGRMNERNFFEWNARHALDLAGDQGKGVRRSLREDDVENAWLKLQRLFDSLADAHIFASGHSIDRWKWRLAKLKQIGEPEFLRAYRDVQFGSAPNGLRERLQDGLKRADEWTTRIHAQLKTLSS